MKSRKPKCVLSAAIVLLLVMLLLGCTNPSTQIQDSLRDYSRIITEDFPEDLCLTIYYLDPSILTRRPLSVEDLMSFPETQKIVIEAEELSTNIESFKKLNASMLKPAKEKVYVDARLYYVLDAGENNKVLDVVISQTDSGVIMNGIEVEYNPIFHELVAPFLPNAGDGALP